MTRSCCKTSAGVRVVLTSALQTAPSPPPTDHIPIYQPTYPSVDSAASTRMNEDAEAEVSESRFNAGASSATLGRKRLMDFAVLLLAIHPTSLHVYAQLVSQDHHVEPTLYNS